MWAIMRPSFWEEEDGAVIVGIIERDGGIYNPAGLSVEAVKTHLNATGGVAGFHGATFRGQGRSPAGSRM